LRSLIQRQRFGRRFAAVGCALGMLFGGTPAMAGDLAQELRGLNANKIVLMIGVFFRADVNETQLARWSCVYELGPERLRAIAKHQDVSLVFSGDPVCPHA
jgi:hypothetical protein